MTPHAARSLALGGAALGRAKRVELVSNYAGRTTAGIHYRSDAAAALVLGEDVAIAIIEDERATLAEDFDGFVFTKFDGSPVVI